MMKQWLLGVVMVFAVLGSWHTIVLAASISSKSEVKDRSRNEQQDEEQQLESLKSPKDADGKMAMVESDSQTFSDINGKVEMHSEREEKIADANSGKLVANLKEDVVMTADTKDNSPPKTRVKTELNIPSKGIHQVTVNKKAKIDSLYLPEATADDYYSPYDGIQYTPMDMAEYILRTGDDEGVSMAIEELMRDGMLTRNEAVAYLEDIKTELEYLWEKVSSERKLASTYLRKPTLPPAQKSESNRPTTVHSMFRPVLSKPTPNTLMKPPEKSSSIKIQKPRIAQMNTLETTEDDDNFLDARLDGFTHTMEPQDVEYNELLERLRIADFLYKEYSLEEVIYHLAKEMFTQSAIKGQPESLQRFSSFLQEETAKGRISKELQAKIIEVMMAALIDVVSVQPGGNNSERNRNQTPSTSSANKDLRDNKSEKFNPVVPERMKSGNKSFSSKHPTTDKAQLRTSEKSSQQRKPN